jgi:phospholipid/cholesterol/gamma-HCH transport system substrate-binding protein
MRRRRRAHRRQPWLGAGVIAVLAAVAWLSTVAIDGLPWSRPYEVRIALPAGAPLLHSGDDVRVAGERVGQVSSVSLGRSGQGVATLSLGSQKVGPGATARVRPRGLAGAVYVDLTPGQIGRPWRSGSLITDTTGGVQLSDVISSFDADAREAMQRSLAGYGTGLAGQGVAANHVIAAAPALLTDLTATLGALTPQPGTLAQTIGSASAVARALAPAGDTTLVDLVATARAVVETTGNHANAIATTIGALPGVEQTTATVLPHLDTLLASLSGTATVLTPGIDALARALPGLETLEVNAPAISTLGTVASAAAPVLGALTPVLARLRGPAAGLVPLSSPAFELAELLIPYKTELIQAPLGFTRWGNFTYDFGTGAGHRAVRFSMILTCAHARDPYPAAGAASKDRKPCP